jgi:hypothetical protein
LKTKNEFINYYKKITKNDEELKAKKENLLNTNFFKPFLYLLAFCVLTFLFFLFIFPTTNFDNSVRYVYPAIICSVATIAIITRAAIFYAKNNVIGHFEARYKKQLISFLLEDDTSVFLQESSVSKQAFKDSKLYSYFNRYKGEDLVQLDVQSSLGEISVSFSDLTVENESSDDDGTSTTTIFKGVFGHVQFKKSFDFQLTVNKSLTRNKKISLESEEFNRKFKVYSDDPIASRLIFTPDRMQQMLTNISKPIKLHIVNNIIYFAIENENLFQSKLCRIEKEINVDDFYNDIAMINTLIEQLKKVIDDIS